MSILTKPSNPLSAATEYGFELSIPELLQLVQSVTNSDYWEDINNWREVDFVYVNAQKQYQRIVFDLVSNEVEVDYAFNENCINGLFECGRITVFGYVNDSLRIKRVDYGAEFDVIIVDGIELGTSIVINSVTPPMFGNYVENDVLTFTLNFSNLVNITGLSLLNEDGTLVLLEDEFALMLEDTRLALLVGSEIRYATYVSGSESVYEYVVQAGDQDLDGIEILSLDLNGGTIIGVNGESVNITLPTTDTSGIIIDNVAPDTTVPTITNILVTDGIYGDQEDIIFTVEFSEGVIITGLPVLTLDIGGVTKQAILAQNMSDNQKIFFYTVEQPDNDNNGIEILSLDGGVVTDFSGNILDRTLPVVDTSNVLVSTVAPDTTSPTILSITAPNGIYKAGNSLVFTATFSEPVVITGTPYLLVDIGGTQVQANMTSSNSQDATFSYTVLAGQLDTDGVQVLSLDSAVITDNALNLLDRTLPAMDMSLVTVDTIAPFIFHTIAPTNGTYGVNQLLQLRLFFNEYVVVTGTPTIDVVIGSSTKTFQYNQASSTQGLAFHYIVVSGDNDTDGIQIGSSILLPGGATIRDLAGNDATLTFTPLSTPNVRIDTTAPTITSMSAPADDNYATGEVISFVANFSENVVVTGTPFLQVTIGSSAKQFNYVSGSGTNALTFSYTVLSGDLDDNGISFASTSIQAPSATIRDATGNNAVLSFTAPTTTGITVNFTPVTTNPISIAGDALYSLKYNSFDNNLYISKVNTSDFFQSPGLYVSNNDGLTYTQKTPIGINAIKEVTSTGNAYSTNLSISDSGIYQSLNSGVTFNLADNVFTNALHDVKYYSAGNKIFGVSLSTTASIGYVWEGDNISINRIPFQTSVGSPLINTYLTNIHLENNLMYLGTETGLCISDLNSDLAYFDALSLGGERYVLNTASATLPLNNVAKVIANGSEVYAIISDTIDSSETAPRTLYYSNNSGTSFSALTTPVGVVQNITIGNYVYILVLDVGQRKLYRKEGDTFVLIPLPQNDAYLIDSGDDKVFIGNITGSSLYIVNDV